MLPLLVGGAALAGGLLGGALVGGGGARSPRMNAEQKELLRSQANLNNAMAGRIANGCDRSHNAQQGLCGNQCGHHRCGPIGHEGMHGSRGCHGGSHGPHRCIEALHHHRGEQCGGGFDHGNCGGHGISMGLSAGLQGIQFGVNLR